jgi:hypothetical protein
VLTEAEATPSGGAGPKISLRKRAADPEETVARNAMNSLMRERLRKFALGELEKTKDDTEEWSFLFRTEGSVSYFYSPWAAYEDEEFDGDVDQLDLPWTLERRDELTSGRANPTEKELQQWREASCRWASNFTDWSYPAWIVPLRPLGPSIEG